MRTCFPTIVDNFILENLDRAILELIRELLDGDAYAAAAALQTFCARAASSVPADWDPDCGYSASSAALIAKGLEGRRPRIAIRAIPALLQHASAHGRHGTTCKALQSVRATAAAAKILSVKDLSLEDPAVFRAVLLLVKSLAPCVVSQERHGYSVVHRHVCVCVRSYVCSDGL